MRNRQGFVAARVGIRERASVLLETLGRRAGGCASFVRRFALGVVAVFFVLVVWPQNVAAIEYTFTKIADFDTAVPGGIGNFVQLGGTGGTIARQWGPSIDNTDVVFHGVGAGIGEYSRVGRSEPTCDRRLARTCPAEDDGTLRAPF